jgi:hypothetical protein
VQTEPSPTLFDPEHDAPRGLPRGLSSNAISAYQRVVVNPLLAILGWLLAIVLIRYSTRSHNLALYLTAILWLFVPFVLVQFHCLDCRVTGWLLRVRRHACSSVIARCVSKESLRGRWPSITVQIHCWIYALVALAILGFVLFASRR